MGIPRLAGHFQPYAVTSTLGSGAVDSSDHANDTSTSPSQIIIDGPSLAYQVYHRLLAHHATSLKGLDAIPSYSQIGAAALAYLDCLEAHGCHMYSFNAISVNGGADRSIQLTYLLRWPPPHPQARDPTSTTRNISQRPRQDTRLVPRRLSMQSIYRPRVSREALTTRPNWTALSPSTASTTISPQPSCSSFPCPSSPRCP